VKRASALVIVTAMSAAVVILALGGSTHSASAAACNTDARTVETAVAALSTEYPDLTPTRALLTGTAAGGPYLSAWPAPRSDFAISLDHTGAVMVSVPASAPPVPYDTANPCGQAK
jgi:hypothetical protein